MIRKPIAAGRFYPDDIEELNNFFCKVFKEPCKKYNRIKGILVPHAGYIYSGRNAGEGYSCLKDIDFNTVVILGTAHTVALKGFALTEADAFLTPYGEVKVDRDINNRLVNSKIFECSNEAHQAEHSVEVQLPFLQYFKRNKNFKIVPIVVNTQDTEILKKGGDVLSELLREPETIMIISSDLSHYPPKNIAEISDKALIKSYSMAVTNKDMDFFALAYELLMKKYRREMDTAACGFSAMYAAGQALFKAGFGNFDFIEYVNSGNYSGDDSNVVGYACGVFIPSLNSTAKIELSDMEKQDLLALARRSIEYFATTGKKMGLTNSENINFNIPAAIFVTLTKKGQLRGCIGTMTPHSLLQDAICEYAYSAAFNDPRFEPVSAKELKDIHIEISILSPLVKVDSYEEIKENIHGVYIKRGFRSGTYLPQVWQHFKNKEDFLSSLCYEKAGLKSDAWRDKNTELWIYTVNSFEE